MSSHLAAGAFYNVYLLARLTYVLSAMSIMLTTNRYTFDIYTSNALSNNTTLY